MDVLKSRRSSSRKHRYSSGGSTYCKPTVNGSTHSDTCTDEGEIEFEGWVEFVTKNDNDECNKYEDKYKKSNTKKNNDMNVSYSQEDMFTNKIGKRERGSRRKSHKNYTMSGNNNNSGNNNCNNSGNNNCNNSGNNNRNNYCNNDNDGNINGNNNGVNNTPIKNGEISDYSYTNANNQYEQPVMALNSRMIYAEDRNNNNNSNNNSNNNNSNYNNNINNNNDNNNNSKTYPFIINTPEKMNNSMNVLSPNYVDPTTPVVLKNQQVLPQLYIRQPPTVIVTNEPRPPLVINPPPANIVFKNKAPQPIYVNSTRPNIIIKNDPAILQNPTDMDTTPIQLDMPLENYAIATGTTAVTTATCTNGAINEAIKYPSLVNIKKEPVVENRNCFFKGNTNSGNDTIIPTNIIQVDNNETFDISQQMMPNVYMMNDHTQGSSACQVQYPHSTTSSINNVIAMQQQQQQQQQQHQQQNQQQNQQQLYNNNLLNLYEPRAYQYVHPSYAQITSQPELNAMVLNQQHVMTNPLMQVVPSPKFQSVSSSTVQSMPLPAVQLFPQTQNLEAYKNAQNVQMPLSYERNYIQQIPQASALANNLTSYNNQNYIPPNTFVQDQVSNNILPQRRTVYPNNNNLTHTTPNLIQLNSMSQNMNVNKPIMRYSSTSSEYLPTCSTAGCIATNKSPQHTQPVQYSQPLQNTQSGQYGQPLQNTQSGQYGQPLQNTQSGQYGQPLQNTQSGQYGQPLQNTQSGQYGQPLQNQPLQNTQSGQYGQPFQHAQSAQYDQPLQYIQHGQLRRQNFINPNGQIMQPLPKKVQILARPM
ncbi:conserved Plasmodium protein, unknown function [Plasmodium malariae]|uniref:Pv-fam-g protein n=1 Tax=Plasmodium malariae TaxID=5858 RepID=A0A1C3L1F6_PLAMA|nr:conserved Plasmodium protein, unknown function [Plasmodium malariae]